MTVQALLIIEAIALVFICGAGFLILRKTPPQAQRLNLVFYLQGLALTILFIIFSLAQGWSSLLLQPALAVLVLCSPLVLGLLTLILTGVFSRLSPPAAQSTLALSLLCFVTLGLMAALLLQPYALFIALLPGAILLTCVWLLVRQGVVEEILLSLLLILLMGVSRMGVLEPMLSSLPAWLGQVLRPVLFLQAGLIVPWSALLTFRAVESLISQARVGEVDFQRIQRFRAFLRLGMSSFLLINLVYTIFWVSIWDHTDNGLGAVWMAITGSFLSIAAGGLIMERRKGWLRSVGLVYLIPVTALIWAAFGIGIRYPYHPISDHRAIQIQEAIQKYFEKNGAYPATLSELVPRQLLWVPRQLILRSEDWCYQGGQDYYRLGVFWRDRFSGLLETKTYASEGNPPDAGWACQENLVKMKFEYDPAPLFGGGQ
jgi:hypothetical protein